MPNGYSIGLVLVVSPLEPGVQHYRVSVWDWAWNNQPGCATGSMPGRDDGAANYAASTTICGLSETHADNLANDTEPCVDCLDGDGPAIQAALLAMGARWVLQFPDLDRDRALAAVKRARWRRWHPTLPSPEAT